MPKNIKKSFRIACVGASAGGLEALTALFKAIPKNINMSFVLIQHLEPHHESMLSEILSKETALNIKHAKENAQLRPGTVYVITPNSSLTISRGKLKIAPRDTQSRFLPIDRCMVSLADDQGKNAIGVVLSGTGSDGTEGVKEIKARGGVTFAQDKKSSKYDSMPAAAVASEKIDFILKPVSIAKKLIDIAAHGYGERELRKGTAPQKKTEPVIDNDVAMDAILHYLRDLSGVDFVHYKRNTLERRIRRRMEFRKTDSLTEYYNCLRSEPVEAKTLYKDLFIPVTMFFRDLEMFTDISKKVLPVLTKNRAPDNLIRIWVPACSTGEEAYSIAITVYEFLEEKKITPRFQIFATDLIDGNIEKSRAACYPATITENVSAIRLRRFFTETETGGYKIAKHIREKCIFSKHDITNDPPLSNMDIISCRNLLIYFDNVLQKKVLCLLHYALKPECFLILGTAESVTLENKLFKVVDKRNKIYSKVMRKSDEGAIRNKFSWSAKPIIEEDRPMTKKTSAAGKARHSSGKHKSQASAEVDKKEYDKMGPVELKKELARTKKKLETIIEEKEGFNERLTLAYEELQSANEEMQSTNEELETSKEELQSTNEELITVNDEMQTKNAELSRLNNDLSNVLTSVNIPLIIVTTDLTIVRFTPLARKFVNLLPGDLGRPIGDFKLSFDIPSFEMHILEVVESLNPFEMDVKDKEGRWHSLRIRPYKTVDNKIDGAVISLIDIDTIKNFQNDLQDALDYADSIVENVREGLLVIDNNLYVISANKSFERIFRTAAADVLNKSIYSICDNMFDRPELKETLNSLLSKKVGPVGSEIEIGSSKASKEEKKTLSIMMNSVYLRGKDRQMILVSMADITDRKQAEAVLQRDAETLKKLVDEQTDRLLHAQLEIEAGKRLSDIGVLAATVAHELRNPLAAIQIAAHNVKKKAQNSEFSGNLSIIEKKVAESDQIINNLLFYSRLKPLHLEKTNIPEIIEECLAICNVIYKKNIVVSKKFQSLGKVLIEVDHTQIKEVLSNLLNNAYDAVPADKGNIEIIGASDEKFLRVTIKDNGSGINKASLTKIFDPFFTTKTKGTGLGLSVAKRIVESHGGKIDVESEPDRGTSITISLPRKND